LGLTPFSNLNIRRSVYREGDVLTIFGGEPKGGATFEGFGDHRMAMASAVFASALEPACIIKGAECVSKSYPDFFADFRRLGGKIDVGV